MRKRTSTMIGIAIATILTAYTSASTVSNQAFAQCPPGTVGRTGGQGGVGQILTGHESQPDKNPVPHVGQDISQLGQVLAKGLRPHLGQVICETGFHDFQLEGHDLSVVC